MKPYCIRLTPMTVQPIYRLRVVNVETQSFPHSSPVPLAYYTSSTKLEKYRGDALRRYILNFAADTTRRSKSFSANHKSQHRKIPKVHTNSTCFSKMFSGLRSQCIRRLWNSASKQCSIEWANLRTRCREKPRNLFRFVTYSNSIAAGKIASENKQQFYYCFVL